MSAAALAAAQTLVSGSSNSIEGTAKQYLKENPFDIRRAYIAAGVAQKLAATTLLGRATKDRKFHFGGAQAGPAVGAAHKTFVGAKPR